MNRLVETIRVLGISGSLRKDSYNTALLRILTEKAAPSIEIDVVTLGDIPLYNEDIDGHKAIPSVADLKDRVLKSDGILIATPEYNHGIPGVLKNALDWVSRPVNDSCMRNKPISIMSSSKAFTGGVRAQYQLHETLISMSARVVLGPEVVVSGVHTKLSGGVYHDQQGLEFILSSLDLLRDEIFRCRSLHK